MECPDSHEKKKKRRRREEGKANRNKNKKRAPSSPLEISSKSESSKPPGAEFKENYHTGVFDFPWLKEGLISEPDNSGAEDIPFLMMLALFDSTKMANGMDHSELCSYQTPARSVFDMTTVGDYKFHDFHRSESEGETSESQEYHCIWSSLLNQPITTLR